MASPQITSHCDLIEEYLTEEWVMDLRRGGGTWLSIMAEMTSELRKLGIADIDLRFDPKGTGVTGITRPGLRRWLHLTDPGTGDWGPRFLAWRSCAAEAAEAKVERAQGVLEGAKETTAGVQKAKALAEHLRWDAGKLDRATYGDAPAVSLTMNLGEQYLEALKRPRVQVTAVEVVPLLEAGE